MDAAPALEEIAHALAEAKLEAILIGNAGAALQGAPVTTVDFDFFYRTTSAGSEAKIRKVATVLGADATQPFPGLSTVYRLRRPDPELQVDFTASIHGAKSFNSLRSRCTKVEIHGCTVLVASLADIIRSKKEANRPNDRAVLHVLEQTLKEKVRAEADEA
jgi:predicted nucleotidyltransferase